MMSYPVADVLLITAIGMVVIFLARAAEIVIQMVFPLRLSK